MIAFRKRLNWLPSRGLLSNRCLICSKEVVFQSNRWYQTSNYYIKRPNNIFTYRTYSFNVEGQWRSTLLSTYTFIMILCFIIRKRDGTISSKRGEGQMNFFLQNCNVKLEKQTKGERSTTKNETIKNLIKLRVTL